MLRIAVENFSCIKRADFTFGRLSVLIGPQASGKSVICKLAYFFVDLLNHQYERILEQTPFDEFSEEIKTQFAEWFPVTAWGQSKLKIEFEIGDYKLRITRTSYDKSTRDNLRLWTSPLVKSHYAEALGLVKSLREKSTRRGQEHFAEFELGWEIRGAAGKLLAKEIGPDYIQFQTFIPAGRSFFTTLGRAFMAFDQGSTLDPITVRFGRYYSSIFYDELRYGARARALTQLDNELSTMLGGSVIWDGDKPALKSGDGRTVPFSALSSGQQELLPLVVALSPLIRRNRSVETRSHLMYIEEPEAHLFPSAQSQLVKGLASLISDENGLRRIALTTHSPYVLSQINNLIKAGSLATVLGPAKRERLVAIVPARFHIEAAAVKAYAIEDGELRSIIDDDGLIAADYLDSISGDISAEFSNLLALEYSE